MPTALWNINRVHKTLGVGSIDINTDKYENVYTVMQLLLCQYAARESATRGARIPECCL